jgi:hypothetical protein
MTLIKEQVQAIWESLWQRSKNSSARLIIGAGFSLNADTIVPSARKFPLWRDLAAKMLDGLPGGDISNPLHLAQAYAHQHGATGLRKLIESEVPDNEYAPSDLHRQLLSLPWVDVFTTNYDTLLERAVEGNSDAQYHTIYSPRDVAGKFTRRLVKLHGTVGLSDPLVATLDDYTNYAKTHEPFETLMRQVLAESTFVLIGFKGDDPNFQVFWGWVRRCFGPNKPQVFWCGLDLDANSRLVLESQDITPLDLAPVVGDAPNEGRYALAIRWLLQRLEPRPAIELNWAPREVSAQSHGFTSFSRFPHGEGGGSPESLMDVTAIWHQQRQEYPGWHILPDEVRERIWDIFEHWRRAVFKGADALEPVSRLFTLHECYWRIELSLAPILTSEADKFIDWLESVDPFGSLGFANAVVSSEAQRARAQEAWQFLALCVLRTARDDLDTVRFEQWHARLTSVAGESPSLRAELRHESVLHSLNRLDLATFRRELADWRRVATLPIEFAQLAVYAAESGDKEAAEQLAKRALGALGSPTPAAVWLGVWCQMLIRALHWRDSSPDRQRSDEAISRAKLQGYNPWQSIEEFRDRLKKAEPPRRPAVSFTARFDSGDVRRSVHLGGGFSELPAFQLLRFLERAPIGIYAGELCNFDKAVAHAAVHVGECAPHWVLATLLRAQAKPEVIDEFYDRLMVANCSQTEADVLCARLLGLIRHEWTEHPNLDEKLGERMVIAALDVLSRFAFRQSVPQLRALIAAFRDWHQSPALVTRHDLAGPLWLLLKRVVNALPDEEIPATVVILLDLPVFGETHFQAAIHEQLWQEPFDALYDRSVSPPRDWKMPEAAWNHLIGFVRSDPATLGWRHAFARLYYLYNSGWLDDAQNDALEDALWMHPDAVSKLPRIPGFRARLVLRMRGAGIRNAAGLLKESLLSQAPKPWSPDGRSIDMDRLAVTRSWIEGLESAFRHPAFADPNHITLPLSADEAVQLVQLVNHWFETVKLSIPPRRDTNHPMDTREIEHIVSALGALFGESLLFYLPKSFRNGDRVSTMFAHLRQLGYPLHRLMPGELFLKPETAGTLAAHIIHALLSDDEATVNAGIKVMRRWFHGHRHKILPSMPHTVIDTAAIRLGLRCAPGLAQLAYNLSGFLEELGVECPRPLVERLLIALVEIANASEPALLKQRIASGEVDRKYVLEHLHIRSWAAYLARKVDAVYAAWGEPRPQILLRWQEIREQSVLPEIRRA